MLRYYSTKVVRSGPTKAPTWSRAEQSVLFRGLSTGKGPAPKLDDAKDHYYNKDRVSAMVGHNFPDYIERWNRDNFKKVGYGLAAATAMCAVCAVGGASALTASSMAPAVILGTLTAGYWHLGLQDIRQTSHAIRRNYPVLGNVRYILEVVRATKTMPSKIVVEIFLTDLYLIFWLSLLSISKIRPELRQYIVESDGEGRPYDRLHRTQIYQRAKDVDDTMPFGTRRNVYDVHHEWACHSMWPVELTSDEAKRYTIGSAEFGTTKPYSASVLNVSGMSYGAISDNAILALNTGARYGNFFQNTGEGSVSRFHLEGGGDIVWNIGAGYFGCGSGTGSNRVFEPTMLKDTIEMGTGRIKMLEIKLSQGAKPGLGGILPKVKITEEIARARKLEYPPTGDCHSPARHSAFNNAYEMVEFVAKVRELGGGIPVGIKLCVGEPGDIAALCKAIVEVGTGPDFISVDGAEGGTGAAPPELSNSVGLPLEEGIVVVRNMLVGAGLKEKVAINASGRVTNGFSLVRTIALGANITSAARAFMMSLGCIQALKCNTNKCPTGIATLNKDLMFGLDPEQKSVRGESHSRSGDSIEPFLAFAAEVY
jgi:glutamate synthase domain-containing protein 2